MVAEHIANSTSSVQNKVSIVSRMKRKDVQEKKRELDRLCFNGVSVGTILKNHAETDVNYYLSLNNKAKHVVGMSLNSTVPALYKAAKYPRNCGLKSEMALNRTALNKADTWGEIKEKFHMKNKKNTSKSKLNHLLKIVNKTMKRSDLTKAYIDARNLEIEYIESSNESIFNIYSHIINIYRFHSEALRFKSNDPTELDNLMKVWGPIFEILFPDTSTVRCKWGESQAEHNKFKVDCHLIFYYNDKLIDVANIEAARYMTAKKTNDDHLKLAIESKDILDFIIKNSSSFDHKSVSIPLIQICNNSCDVLKLHLVDNGLYCIEEYFNLTIPFNPTTFARNASDFFFHLVTLKYPLDGLFISAKEVLRPLLASSNRQTEEIDYTTWLRGSFYPPLTDNDLIYIPENLYGPTNNASNKKQKQ
ncbi:hypothetical protein BD770DRAFT_438921 [Pilaira anomala]|nr:hypothetical protein BD770DRAFT_438921 [Pilaira anomala]